MTSKPGGSQAGLADGGLVGVDVLQGLIVSRLPLSPNKHLMFSMTQPAALKGRFIILYNSALVKVSVFVCVSRRSGTPLHSV